MTQTSIISKAIVRVQADIRAASKSGDNKFDKYNYSKLEDFFAVAKPAMASNGLALVVSVKGYESLPDRSTKNGGFEHAVRVMLEGTLIHESGETISVQGCGEGQDRADKAIYKAITGGKKYLLASLFSIPTTDDPEADETVGLSPGKRVEQIDTTTGEARTSKTKWSPEQTTEIGVLFAEIRELGGKAEVDALWKAGAYNPVSDTMDKADVLLRKWRDIADQANQGPKL